MRSVLKKGAWVGAGAAAAYLFDPVTGRKRRADLLAQARARLSDVGRLLQARAKYQAGVAKGWVHETLVPEEPPASDGELLQKVRSEAVGPTGGVGHVDLRVDGGVVRLTGVSRDPGAEQELMERIAAVVGVREVRNELSPA